MIEHKEEVLEIIEKIKSNSKDVNECAKMLSDLIALVKSESTKPTIVHVPKEEVFETYNGEYFTIFKCEDKIVFETKGGCTHIFDEGNSFYPQVDSALDVLNNHTNVEESEYKELYENDAQATLTLFALFSLCGDLDTKYRVVGNILSEMKNFEDEELVLKEEDNDANKVFVDALNAIEELKKIEENGEDES